MMKHKKTVKNACSPIVIFAKPKVSADLVCQVTISMKLSGSARSDLIRCKHNCLRCTNSSDDCINCPFNRFTLSEPVKTTGNANNFFKGFLSLILGKAALGPNMQMTEIHISSKCVVECPKIYNKKPVNTDYVNRRCV